MDDMHKMIANIKSMEIHIKLVTFLKKLHIHNVDWPHPQVFDRYSRRYRDRNYRRNGGK